VGLNTRAVGFKLAVYFGQALGLVLVLVGAFVLNLKT